MIVRRSAWIALVCALVLDILIGQSPVAAVPQRSDEQIKQEMAGLAWQRGPVEGRIGSVASIKVGDRQAFLDGPNTRRFLELNGNPPRDERYVLVSSQWFAVFFFENAGYVKDDEKLDAAALLASLQQGDKASNAERERLGMTPLHTEGWHVLPHYDPTTKRLEWGVRLRGGSEERTVVNYSIRLLGRRGVMHAILVSDPESLDRDIAEFKTALGGYEFASGERYSEFRAGDRVAEYGLAALVLGGAAAVATKSGFGKAIGKFVVVGVAALGSAIVALFRRLTRRA
ncbi:MAG TPA: DUF2167 domain-containing protein [Patescibacteria group bacterium]|nr:DUF2167 domain-containing protein [Patescibacteria group bacterium]